MTSHSPAQHSAASPRDVLLRLSGEVTTKGRHTRLRFQRGLARNLRAALTRRDFAYKVEEDWSRLYLSPEAAEEKDLASSGVLAEVFGISSYSPIDAECEADLGRIVETGSRIYSDMVEGRTFAVRARRSGQHGFRSRDVMVELGAALNELGRVDLSNPDVVVSVEVRDGRTWFYSERLDGPGGLPLGVEGRAVCLLSGGFDSGVAAWMLLRRGVSLDYVFCNLGGAAYRRMVLQVAHVLADRWSYGIEPRIHVVPFGPVVAELRRVVRPAYLQVALKRQMYAAAEHIAEAVGGEAIVTGEAVGQVSSQTLTNLRAIDNATSLPVLRPLIGYDKEQIIASARHVGTHDLSARVREYCSIGDGRTATGARPAALESDVARMNPAVLAQALDRTETVRLKQLDLAELALDGLFVDEIRPGARVVDTRDAAAFRAWHWPGAEHHPLAKIAGSSATLDKKGVHVLVCEQGLLSAQLAERLQSEGYEAYSFAGGAGALRRLQESRAEQPAATPGGHQ
ncbi:MAG: tRNA uracil 4-sulfurtransferase ThiI [Gemmatimonadota bacterium]